jgi:phage baseplate assembly protein V
MQTANMADADAFDDMIRYGKVDSVDLAAGRCVIRVGDILTQPVKWLELRAGRTRTWSPPSTGEQVVLLCPAGDIAGAIAIRGVSSDAYRSAGDSERELIEFGDGTIIAYDPAAHLFELLAGAGRLRVAATGGLSIEGPVTITGSLAVDGKISATDDVEAAGKSLTDHVHLQVQPGSGVSGRPR